METKKDALDVQVVIMEGEKKDFEERTSEIEAHKYATDRQIGELRTRVDELEEQNEILENQLKAANERHPNITPFHDRAF